MPDGLSYHDRRFDAELERQEPGLDHRKLCHEILGADVNEQTDADLWCYWIDLMGYEHRIGQCVHVEGDTWRYVPAEPGYELHAEFAAWKLEQARILQAQRAIEDEVRQARQLERAWESHEDRRAERRARRRRLRGADDH
jgi:hypothetical protein